MWKYRGMGSRYYFFSSGLLDLVNDFDFNFLLETFSFIFPHSEIFFDFLQTKQVDIVFCNKKTADFKCHLQHLMENFDHNLNNNILNFDCPQYKRICLDNWLEKKQSYSHLYHEITDMICLNRLLPRDPLIISSSFFLIVLTLKFFP